jgi:hypothetical protein
MGEGLVLCREPFLHVVFAILFIVDIVYFLATERYARVQIGHERQDFVGQGDQNGQEAQDS